MTAQDWGAPIGHMSAGPSRENSTRLHLAALGMQPPQHALSQPQLPQPDMPLLVTGVAASASAAAVTAAVTGDGPGSAPHRLSTTSKRISAGDGTDLASPPAMTAAVTGTGASVLAIEQAPSSGMPHPHRISASGHLKLRVPGEMSARMAPAMTLLFRGLRIKVGALGTVWVE